MGTRHATGVRYENTDKLSYNQFDGYPSGTGNAILTELREEIAELGYDQALAKWREQAKALVMKDESEAPTAEEMERYKDAHDSRVSTGEDWYSLLRGDQGSILKRLRRGVATNSGNFILDSLFCEWAYVLNLDEEVLEVYEGFQKKRHMNGRYAELKSPKTEYYPCALIGTLPLQDLPLAFTEDEDGKLLLKRPKAASATPMPLLEGTQPSSPG